MKAALQEASRLKGQLKESWERAQMAYQEAGKQTAAVEEAFKQTMEQVGHIQRKVQRVKEEFLSALKEANFASTEEFLQARLSPQKWNHCKSNMTIIRKSFIHWKCK